MSKRLFTNTFFLLILLFSTLSSLTAQVERPATERIQALPEWARMMYGEDPNVGEVMAAYKAYYQSHTFVKNEHTQYYKRWLHTLKLEGDINHLTPEERAAKVANEIAYLKKYKTEQGRDPNSTWSCVGPFDFDKGAAAMSYAPGAAHVYTTEQSVSNPNVLYAGSATAGLWKSTDKGLNWSLLTRNMLITEVYAVEIDPTNENIVYFSAGGKLYKSVDGGTTITQAGDAAFNALSHDITEITTFPTSANTIFVASNQGLYRSTDAGANFTRVLSGSFQEVEFKPGTPNTMYAIKVSGNHTEFYKSTDGGLTFAPKAGGYPGVASVASVNFPSKKFNATTDYVKFGTNDNLGSGSNADFTIEMWVKSNGWTGDPAIFSNKNWASSNNKGFVLYGKTNGTQWRFGMGNGTSNVSLDGGNIADGDWHHIAVVYRTTGQKETYQDGVLQNTSATNLSGTVNNALQMALGQDGTLAYGYGFKGDIAEVRVWNTALSSTTLNAWKYSYITNAHPNYANMIRYWKLNEGTGTNVADSKGTNTGTVFGTAGWTASNSWYQVTSNITGSDEQKRTEIAVSPANANIIYALATGAADGGTGLYGVYRSTDAGENWTFRCCGTGPGGVPTPTNFNLMGWDDGGQDDGGQYYYDLSLGVSPTNPDSVFVCGVNLWESTNGGASFVCPSKWSHSNKVNYVHADIHDIKIYGNDMWLSCDGGVFYSNDRGNTWNRRMFGIAGTDFWGFGAGFLDGSVMIGGTYHNGTLLKDGNTYINGWLSTDGGDGTRGYVNPGKPRIAYSDYNKKLLSGDRTVSPITYDYGKKPNTDGNMEFHPRNYNTIYSPVDSILWKTTDDGVNWVSIKNFGNGNTVEAVKIAWTDPNIMYVVTSPGFYDAKTLWRSADAGATWTNITPSLATINNNTGMPFRITVSGSDANTVWLALTHPYSWYTADGYKIFKTTNGGTSWTNLSTATLNGEYIKDIEHVRGSDGGVYIGTGRTVYYRNNTMADWVVFNNNLPAQTYCTKLLTYYKGGKIRNGTSRSVYEANFYENTPPQAQISVDKFTANCSRDSFYFVNHSACRDDATFLWSFPGGNPATSTAENPVVTFPAAGTYSVSLTVTDAYGTSSQNIPNLVTVLGTCEPDSFALKCISFTGTSTSNAKSTIPAPNFGASQNFSVAFYFKTTSTTTDGAILTDKDWYSGGYKGWVFSLNSGKIWFNIGDGNGHRIDLYSQSGINDGQWHCVAASVTRTGQAVLYMDGVQKATTSMAALGDIYAGFPLTLGTDVYGNYAYNGQVEEVKIWNAALTQSELREKMHLTAISPDANLISYLQFNGTGTTENDRKGFWSLNLTATATRVTSTAPVGPGVSVRQTVTAAGLYNLPTVGVKLGFKTASTYPAGELCISRLNCNPDAVPNAYPNGNRYCIIDNYGTNATFTALDSVVFSNSGHIAGAATTATNFKLYKRGAFASGANWGAIQDSGDRLIGTSDVQLTYSTSNNITSMGQFVIHHEEVLSATATGTNVSCYGSNNGSATAASSGGYDTYTYLWSNGATGATNSGLAPGTYTVTATSGASTATASVTITQPAVLTATASGTNPTSGSNGSATVSASGGTPAYSYLWSNGMTTASISDLAAGTYTATVTDTKGCTTIASVALTWPALSLNTSVTNVSCNGGSNGSATVNATGGSGSYSYLWSNAATSATISGLTAGNYSVTVSSGGLTATSGVTITQPAVLTATASGTNPTSGSNGSATVSASGGTPSYSYLWSNGMTTASISALAAGTYTATVTDINGCTTSSSVTLTSSTTALLVTLVKVNVSCYGGNNGSVTANATGGNGSYSYIWNTGATTNAITNLTPGTYRVTVTSGAQSVIKSSTVTQPALFAVTANVTNTSCGLANGAITLTAANGVGSIYSWSNGATTSSLTNITGGDYSVTVTSTKGCIATTAASVGTSVATFSLSLTATEPAGANNGSIATNITGTGAPFTYLWSTGATTDAISGLGGGTYKVTVTAASGCTQSATKVFYCVASGNTTSEWINAVTIGATTNTSGNNGGYANFASLTPVNIVRGVATSVTLTPGFTSTVNSERWRIWVDNNNDGDFADAGELLLTKTGTNVQTGAITIPATAAFGLHRIRVAMRKGANPLNCGAVDFGEVEDYLVNVQSAALLSQASDVSETMPVLNLFPNPTENDVTAQFEARVAGKFHYMITDIAGRVVAEQAFEAQKGVNTLTIGLDQIGNGAYMVSIRGENYFASKVLMVAK